MAASAAPTVVGLAVFLFIFWLVFAWRDLSPIKRHVPVPAERFRFTIDAQRLVSHVPHMLTRDGPYIDAHFGILDEATPVGFTYSMRPYTKAVEPCRQRHVNGCGCGGKGEGGLELVLHRDCPFTNFNDNMVSRAVQIEGTLIIPAEGSGTVSADISLYNATGLPLQGLHVHDGQKNKDGLTGFGKICYFIFASKEWNERYNTSEDSVSWAAKYAPLPPGNLAPKDPMLVTSTQSD